MEEIVNDLDYFYGALEEFLVIAAEQMKAQPVMQIDCIGVILTKQLKDINRRVQQLHHVARSERSDPRARVEVVS